MTTDRAAAERPLTCPVRFDYRDDPGLLTDPWERWTQMRNDGRFSYEEFGGYRIWLISDYEDVRDAFQNYELFSSKTLSPYDPVKEPDKRIIPAEIDPPEHGAYRQMILSYLSPGRVESWEPAVRAWAAELIQGFAADGQCDFMKQFAKRFPTRIFMEIMGLPLEDTDQVLQWADMNLHAAGDPESQAIAKQSADKIFAYLGDLARQRRAEPRDDLMTCIVSTDFNGRKLSEAEVLGYAFTMYLGGLDTVANQLGHIFNFLAKSAEHRRQLVEDPAVIPSAVEELLRYFGILTPGRVVTADADFHGCPMKKGDRALISTLSAGRDAREFVDAHIVDFRRESNRHLAFGAGPHRCIGSHLARLELIVGLEEWHRLIPDYRLAGSATFHAGAVTGLDDLPLTWTP